MNLVPWRRTGRRDTGTCFNDPDVALITDGQQGQSSLTAVSLVLPLRTVHHFVAPLWSTQTLSTGRARYAVQTAVGDCNMHTQTHHKTGRAFKIQHWWPSVRNSPLTKVPEKEANHYCGDEQTQADAQHAPQHTLRFTCQVASKKVRWYVIIVLLQVNTCYKQMHLC